MQCWNKPLPTAPIIVLRVAAAWLHVFMLLTTSSPSKVHEKRGLWFFGASLNDVMILCSALAVATQFCLATKKFSPVAFTAAISLHCTPCIPTRTGCMPDSLTVTAAAGTVATCFIWWRECRPCFENTGTSAKMLNTPRFSVVFLAH